MVTFFCEGATQKIGLLLKCVTIEKMLGLKKGILSILLGVLCLGMFSGCSRLPVKWPEAFKRKEKVRPKDYSKDLFNGIWIYREREQS